MIRNLKIKKKIATMVLVGTISATSLLTGCSNKQTVGTKNTYNKIIIFDYNNKSASIIEVKSWGSLEGNIYRIKTSDGFWFTTSTYDSKLINDEDSEITAEEFVKSILGEDAEINYLLPQGKTKIK